MLVEKVVLNDGTPVAFRSMRRADLPAIQRLHDRASQASLDARYLGGRAPDLADLSRMADRVEEQGAALVVTLGGAEGQVIGFGYYVMTTADPVTVEPALLIEDAYQSMGVGSALAQHLLSLAVASGVQVVEMHVAVDNPRIMQMLRATGLPFEQQFAYGEREIRVVLAGARSVHRAQPARAAEAAR